MKYGILTLLRYSMEMKKMKRWGIFLSVLALGTMLSSAGAQTTDTDAARGDESSRLRERITDQLIMEDRLRDVRTRLTGAGERMQMYLSKLRSRIEPGVGIADAERHRTANRIAQDISTIQTRTLT